jgi:hypothetical protein
MNSYSLSLLALSLGLLGQSIAGGLAFERFFHRSRSAAQSRHWLALAIGALLLALHHGYALELALKTGIHDLRQAILAGVAGLLYAYVVAGFSRRS